MQLCDTLYNLMDTCFLLFDIFCIHPHLTHRTHPSSFHQITTTHVPGYTLQQRSRHEPLAPLQAWAPSNHPTRAMPLGVKPMMAAFLFAAGGVHAAAGGELEVLLSQKQLAFDELDFVTAGPSIPPMMAHLAVCPVLPSLQSS